MSSSTHLSYRVVRRVHRLQAFFSRDTHTNVSSLYHADVIGAVPYGQSQDVQVVLDKMDELCLL